MAQAKKQTVAPIAQPEVKAKPEVRKDTRKIGVGGKGYNPRVAKNASAWDIVQAHFGKTMDQLVTALHHNKFGEGKDAIDMHHVDFIGYMWRKGHITIDGKTYSK